MPDPETAAPASSGAEKKETPLEPKDQLVQTRHVLTVDGRELHYTVTTGTLVLKEEAEKKGKVNHEPFNSYLNESRSDHDESEELAPGIPSVKERVSWKVVESYSLSHEIFSLPKIE